MPFYAPDWVPKLPFDIPDSISVDKFILDENFERHPLGYSRPPFTCGLTGKQYSALEVKERVDFCLLYTSPSPRDGLLSRMPSSA